MIKSRKDFDEEINTWSEALCKRLLDVKVFDKKEVNFMIKSYFKMAMESMLKSQISKTQLQYDELRYSINTYKGREKEEKLKLLSQLKIRLKSENMMYAGLDRDRQAKEMCLWMREKHPESILEFYKMYDKKYSENPKQ